MGIVKMQSSMPIYTRDISITHKHIMRKTARHRHVKAKKLSAKCDVEKPNIKQYLEPPKRMLEKSE